MNKYSRTHDVANDSIDSVDPLIKSVPPEIFHIFTGHPLPGILEDLPVIRTGNTIYKIFRLVRDGLEEHNLLVFLKALANGEKDFDEFRNLSITHQSKIRRLVISQLSLLSAESQSIAMAYAVNAHLRGDFDISILTGLVTEIKNINPLVLTFSSDGATLHYPYDGHERIRITGPVGLPAAMGSSIGSAFNDNGGLESSDYSISKVGEAFMTYVYLPMKDAGRPDKTGKNKG